MSSFKIHTPDSAPEKSREILKSVNGKYGFVPNVFGEMAESPALLRSFWEISESAAKLGRLSPVEGQIVEITASWMNDCSYCIAAHSVLAEKAGVPRDMIDLLRADKPLKDPKHEALRQFTRNVMKRMGRVEDSELQSFIKAGYTNEHVMEVVLHLSAKLISNYVNHIARTPLDQPFEARRVEERTRRESKSNAA